MKEIAKCIESLRIHLERHRKTGLKEYPTRTIFIDPLLQTLGWDVRDPDEVALEHPTVDSKSVDYALKVNRKVVLHLEAKQLGDPLDDVKSITQVVGYAANDGIEWCVLTNGIRYKVYKASEKASAPDKLLFEMSIDPKDSEGSTIQELAQLFHRLSRESLAAGSLDQLGTEIFTAGKVRKALDRLIAEESNSLIRLIRKEMNDPSVSPSQVGNALRRIWDTGAIPPLPAASASPVFNPTGFQRMTSTPENSLEAASPKTRRTRLPDDTPPITLESSPSKMKYGEPHHTDGKPREVVELYRALDRFCLDMAPGQIRREYRAKYVSWSLGKFTFCSAHLLNRNGLRVWIKADPRHLDGSVSFARDVSKIGHWGLGDVELAINSLDRLHDAEPFILESFQRSIRK